MRFVHSSRKDGDLDAEPEGHEKVQLGLTILCPIVKDATRSDCVAIPSGELVGCPSSSLFLCIVDLF